MESRATWQAEADCLDPPTLVSLPFRSPDLNAIEPAFAKLKLPLCRAEAHSYPAIRTTVDSRCLPPLSTAVEKG